MSTYLARIKFYSRYRVEFFVVNRVNHIPSKSIKQFSSIKPREIKQSLHLIRVPELSEKLPEYSTKRFMSKAVSRGHICWSYWLVYLFVFIQGMTFSTLIPDFILFWLVIFLGLPISAVLWFCITYTLIYFRHVNDKFIWLLDKWLTSSGYLDIKEKYYAKKQQMLDFDKVWQQHLVEGQKILNFKKEILSLCDEYALLVSNDDSALQHQKRIEYLAHRLPKTPKELNEKIGFYQNKTEQLLQEWQAMNMEHIELALSYHFNGETLLPEPNQISQTPEIAQVKSFILVFMALPIIIMASKIFGGIEGVVNKPVTQVNQLANAKPVSIPQIQQASSQEKFWETADQTKSQKTPIVEGRVLHAIGVYEGSYPNGVSHSGGYHPQGMIDVTIDKGKNTKSVVLVLTSYEPVQWNIAAKKGVVIDQIILSSYVQPSTVTGVHGIQIIRRDLGSPTEHNEVLKMANLLREELGASRVSAQSSYKGSVFEIY